MTWQLAVKVFHTFKICTVSVMYVSYIDKLISPWASSWWHWSGCQRAKHSPSWVPAIRCTKYNVIATDCYIYNSKPAIIFQQIIISSVVSQHDCLPLSGLLWVDNGCSTSREECLSLTDWSKWMSVKRVSSAPRNGLVRAEWFEEKLCLNSVSHDSWGYFIRSMFSSVTQNLF